MKLTELLRKLPTLLLNDFDDARFVTLRMMTKGMTSPRIAKILYYATHHLDEKKEVYVEQGTWTGFTLASAGLDGTKLVIGIDPYDLEFGTKELSEKARKEMQQNLDFFNTNAIVLQNDFRDVVWERQETIGVLFIDADHTYKDVVDGLVWAEPHFSEEALIVLDDIRAKGEDGKTVEEAMNDWLKEHNEYRLEAFMRGELDVDQYAHNGFAILSYRKKQ